MNEHNIMCMVTCTSYRSNMGLVKDLPAPYPRKSKQFFEPVEPQQSLPDANGRKPRSKRTRAAGQDQPAPSAPGKKPKNKKWNFLGLIWLDVILEYWLMEHICTISFFSLNMVCLTCWTSVTSKFHLHKSFCFQQYGRLFGVQIQTHVEYHVAVVSEVDQPLWLTCDQRTRRGQTKHRGCHMEHAMFHANGSFIVIRYQILQPWRWTPRYPKKKISKAHGCIMPGAGPGLQRFVEEVGNGAQASECFWTKNICWIKDVRTLVEVMYKKNMDSLGTRDLLIYTFSLANHLRFHVRLPYGLHKQL